MWFELIPPIAIITASLALPGYASWWLNYFICGNNLKSITGNTCCSVKLVARFLIVFDFGRILNIIMWYEIIPSFAIITAALGLPGWGLYHLHNLVLGNHFRRSLLDRWDRHMYQRDMRLTGNPYQVNGLDCLPEDPEEKERKKK